MLFEEPLAKVLKEVHVELTLGTEALQFLVWLFSRFERRLDLENLKDQIPQLLSGKLNSEFSSFMAKRDSNLDSDLLFDYLAGEILEIAGYQTQDRIRFSELGLIDESETSELRSISVLDIFNSMITDEELFETFKDDLLPGPVFNLESKGKSMIRKSLLRRQLRSKKIKFTPEGFNFLFQILKNFSLAEKYMKNREKLEEVVQSLPGQVSGPLLFQLEFKFLSFLLNEMKKRRLELHFDGPDCPLVSLLMEHTDRFEPFYYPETV